METKANIKGYLNKNNNTNKVTVENKQKENSQYIETAYEPISSNGKVTLLKLKLITGKAHQIRAHLASVNHFIIGDYKYGNYKINNIYKKRYGIENQLLHSWKLNIKEVEGMPELELQADLPKDFLNIVKKELGDIDF